MNYFLKSDRLGFRLWAEDGRPLVRGHNRARRSLAERGYHRPRHAWRPRQLHQCSGQEREGRDRGFCRDFHSRSARGSVLYWRHVLLAVTTVLPVSDSFGETSSWRRYRPWLGATIRKSLASTTGACTSWAMVLYVIAAATLCDQAIRISSAAARIVGNCGLFPRGLFRPILSRRVTNNPEAFEKSESFTRR